MGRLPPDRLSIRIAEHPAWQAFVAVPDGDVPWERFAAELPRRLEGLTGSPDLAATVLGLLAEHPGTPIGVTFDGGLAITYGDYRAAERRRR